MKYRMYFVERFKIYNLNNNLRKFPIDIKHFGFKRQKFFSS